MGQHLPGNRNNFEWISREEEEKQHHEWKNYWTIVSEAKGRQTHTHKKSKNKNRRHGLLTNLCKFIHVCNVFSKCTFLYIWIGGEYLSFSQLDWNEWKNQRNEQRERKMMYLKNRITRKRVEVDTLQPSRNVLDRLRRRRWRWTDGWVVLLVRIMSIPQSIGFDSLLFRMKDVCIWANCWTGNANDVDDNDEAAAAAALASFWYVWCVRVYFVLFWVVAADATAFCCCCSKHICE